MSKNRTRRQQDWTLWWDVMKIAEPMSFVHFTRMLTDFVEHFPTECTYITIEDLQAILVDT